MTHAYIAVGSNLGDPVTQATQAIKALESLPESRVLQASKLYTSTPMGPQDQPDYINAVVKIETALSPIELLNATQAIEQKHGRLRKEERWGPRTLDLDMLLYGEQVIDIPRLQVPHYGMKEREFVLYPLFEIEPDLILPDGSVLAELIQNVERNGLRVYG